MNKKSPPGYPHIPKEKQIEMFGEIVVNPQKSTTRVADVLSDFSFIWMENFEEE